MATRIINKLYNCFGVLLATKTSLYNEGVYAPVNVDSDLVHVEPQPKRATKNLESLIKALNKQGYTVSLSQIYSDGFLWDCFIHDQTKLSNIVGHSEHMQKTAYLAVKAAIPKYGLFKLEV